jgi:hypothetical protein
MKRLFVTLLPIVMIFLNSCVEDLSPTKPKMEGLWEVTAAYDEQGNDILPKIAYPVVGFHLSSDNTVISTAGPLIMYIVYGGNNYTTMASKMDQVFNYASLDFNGGEYFIGDGVEDRFTLEMKLEGLPGQKTLTTLLQMLNLQNQWLNTVIYHKFMDVRIDMSDNDNTMTWTWDNTTKAIYNTKDQYGNYLLWQGWPVTNFSKCTVVLSKRNNDLKGLVQSNI